MKKIDYLKIKWDLHVDSHNEWQVTERTPPLFCETLRPDMDGQRKVTQGHVHAVSESSRMNTDVK